MAYSRNIPVIVCLLLSFLIIQQWITDHAPQTTDVVETLSQSTDGVPVPENKVGKSVVDEDVPVIKGKDVQAPVIAQQIKVKTDVLEMSINLSGGDIIKASLLKYPTELKSTENVTLLDYKPEVLHMATSGISSKWGPDNQKGRPLYQSKKDIFELPNGADEMQVALNWQNEHGLKVKKIYQFHRGSYHVNVSYEVINNMQESWAGHFYGRLTKKHIENGSGIMGVSSFSGMAMSTQETPYQKVDRDEAFSETTEGGWIAMLQHYFVSAWVPEQGQKHEFTTKELSNDRYRVQLIQQEPLSIASGEKGHVSAKLYMGPKIQKELEVVHPDLKRTVDFGFLWFIASGLFWLLDHFFSFFGNWGAAIIAVTVVVKIAFYPFSASSYRSMAKMRKLTPKLQSLKNKYGDDKQKFSQAMMELYRKEQVNPLGGCLPILIQMPVFLALYWVLFESVELRQAPFIFWIKDLSAKDPYFFLPLVMGLTMVIQQRLNPAPTDPMQAKIMKMMPIVFTGLFLFFPSGLVLYWVCNNFLSILQQWWVTKQIEQAS